MNGRNAIPLCTAAGFGLGMLLSLILGSIFSVGGSSLMFEMGIYVFAGIVGGAALGAFVGFLLTGILPKGSAAETSEQMFSGVCNAIGGFFVAGVALAFFWYFRDVESTGAEPGRMPRIIRFVYEFFGKWGVLIIIGGAGINMMVIGVLRLIPEPAPQPKKKKKKSTPSKNDWEGGPPRVN